MYEPFNSFESKLAEVDKLEKQWLEEKSDLLFKIEKFQREKEDWIRLKKCLFEEIHLLTDQLNKIENCEILTEDLLVPIPETKLTFKPTPPPVQKVLQPPKSESNELQKAENDNTNLAQSNSKSENSSISQQGAVPPESKPITTPETETTISSPSSLESNIPTQSQAPKAQDSVPQSPPTTDKSVIVITPEQTKSEEEEESPEQPTAAKKGGKKKVGKKGGKKALKKKDGTLDPFAPQPYRYAFKTAINHHLDAVRAIVFHSSQPLLASAGDDGSIRLVDLEYKRPVGKKIMKTIQTYCSLRGHSCPIISLASLGNYLYSGDISGHLCVWEFSAAPPGANVEVFGRADHHCLFSDTIHSDAIWSITASEQYFITASADGKICVFNKANQKIDTIDIPEKPVVVSFIYNSQTKFAVGCIDGTINLFERTAEKTEKLNTISIGSRITCVSPNVNELVFGCADRKVARISIDDDNNKMEIKDSHELHGKAVTGIAVLPGGQYIATTSQDKEIRGWHLEGMELRMSDKILREKFGDAGLGIAAPPVNSTLHAFAVASADGSIKLYTS